MFRLSICCRIKARAVCVIGNVLRNGWQRTLTDERMEIDRWLNVMRDVYTDWSEANSNLLIHGHCQLVIQSDARPFRAHFIQPRYSYICYCVRCRCRCHQHHHHHHYERIFFFYFFFFCSDVVIPCFRDESNRDDTALAHLCVRWTLLLTPEPFGILCERRIVRAFIFFRCDYFETDVRPIWAIKWVAGVESPNVNCMCRTDRGCGSLSP